MILHVFFKEDLNISNQFNFDKKIITDFIGTVKIDV
jgi:hypothetical protein